MIEIIALSLIQGITEFLPISSSSHLIIVSEYLEFNNKNLEIDVSLHIGSFLAVIVFFRKDIFNFVQNKDLFLKILIGSLPVMIVGYLLVKFNFIDQIRNIKVIGWTTLIFGILLYLSDKSNVQNKINSNFTLKSAFLIGFLQILSLIPGVSRSGIAITGARALKFNRYDSAKISFLLSIPTLAAVSIFGLNNLVKSESFNFSFLIIISIIFSFLFSFITIKYFLKYIKTFSLNIFVIYRVLLGIGLLVLAYL
jgi:undecaprenyl-diphosphatase